MKLHARQILGAAAVVAVASLAATTVPATANPASVASKFADQGRDANLTSKQIAELQKEVEKQVAVTGGRQIALNKIAVNGGEMGIPVPGEDRVLDLAASKAKATKVYAGCFRATSAAGRAATGRARTGSAEPATWTTRSPTAGTAGAPGRTTRPAVSWQSSAARGTTICPTHRSTPTGIVNGDWAPVWYVRAC